MKTEKGRIGILLSGRGSNFEAIYRNSLEDNAPFRVAVVISDKKNAPGLLKASGFGIPAFYIRPGSYPSRALFEEKLISVFEQHRVDLICLAGFMRIISPVLISRYRGRIMNIHPSLLPLFPGLDAQKQALEAGAAESGCTVHFVDEGMDTGPVIMQRRVPVRKDDTVESLSMRILEEEHTLFPRVIRLYFMNKLKLEHGQVTIIP